MTQKQILTLKNRKEVKMTKGKPQINWKALLLEIIKVVVGFIAGTQV
jgi:hypothetical protein